MSNVPLPEHPYPHARDWSPATKAAMHAHAAAVSAGLAAENARLREALQAALEVMDDLPTWSNAGHACNLARAALKGASHE